jgi:hypothetical protein
VVLFRFRLLPRKEAPVVTGEKILSDIFTTIDDVRILKLFQEKSPQGHAGKYRMRNAAALYG